MNGRWPGPQSWEQNLGVMMGNMSFGAHCTLGNRVACLSHKKFMNKWWHENIPQAAPIFNHFSIYVPWTFSYCMFLHYFVITQSAYIVSIRPHTPWNHGYVFIHLSVSLQHIINTPYMFDIASWIRKHKCPITGLIFLSQESID